MSRILRDIIESELKPCKPYQPTLKDKMKDFKLRKYIASKILGNNPYTGITIQIDLSRKTKEEVDAFWKALEYLRKAGITFDTGCGCVFDMELDWSLRGAKTICRRCGYNSEEGRLLLDKHHRKKHFITICQKCNKKLDSDDGYWNIKKHFWSKTKYYHTDCYE